MKIGRRNLVPGNCFKTSSLLLKMKAPNVADEDMKCCKRLIYIRLMTKIKNPGFINRDCNPIFGCGATLDLKREAEIDINCLPIDANSTKLYLHAHLYKNYFFDNFFR